MKENKNFESHSGTHNQEFEQDHSHEPVKENSQERVLPVIEEEVHVDKKVVETGKVHIAKKITEHEETIDVPLTHEELDIERVEVNQYIDSLPPPVRYEGDTMIIPVLKEVVVKRVMIVEELRVTRKEVQTQEKQQVILKKEEVNVKRTSNPTENPEVDSK